MNPTSQSGTSQVGSSDARGMAGRVGVMFDGSVTAVRFVAIDRIGAEASGNCRLSVTPNEQRRRTIATHAAP